MRFERRFRAVGARTSGIPGNSSRPRTGTCQATDGRQRVVMDRPPLRRSASVRPRQRAARTPGPPQVRGKQPPAPNRSPGPLAKKPASRRQVPHARQRPARRPSSSPGTPPPLRYSPARQHPPPQAPGRQTTRSRQAGPSTGWRRPQDSCIRTNARYGKPNTAAAAGQPTPPAVPPDGIARPGPGPHYTNWSRPISRLI